MAAFALTVPRAFGSSLENAGSVPIEDRIYYITKISRAGGVILIIAYMIYIVFQMFSHHSIISEIFEQDELQDRDREDDLSKSGACLVPGTRSHKTRGRSDINTYERKLCALLTSSIINSMNTMNDGRRIRRLQAKQPGCPETKSFDLSWLYQRSRKPRLEGCGC